ncbi:hypothetical protein FOMPIDRAFT_90921 [Fomitopsis schrenkii]|uniref:Uncharacterized protein n=1 Tax=Fomitopsis schrenkii TaxID=2126942 RepID=S8EJ20_FOMSC|nr:hypothetical protein FOMPIDRAFT_90921 [Fomitopsis schrenkii]
MHSCSFRRRQHRRARTPAQSATGGLYKAFTVVSSPLFLPPHCVLLRTLLDHFEMMEPLCDDLPPPATASMPSRPASPTPWPKTRTPAVGAPTLKRPEPRNADARNSSAVRPRRQQHKDRPNVRGNHTASMLAHLGGDVRSPADVVQGLLAQHDRAKAAN